MKTLLFTVLVFIAPFLRAQNCSGYYFLQNNKTIEMSMYDKKGEITGRLIYSIADVKNSNGMTTANVQSQIFDKKGRTIAKGNSLTKCNGGVIMINMKMVMPTPQAEQFSQVSAKTDDFFIEYPVSMNKGDHLPEGTMSMDVDNNGLQQSITMTVFDRNVEGEEKITTPAGSWECYKITYKSKISIRIMGVGVPINMEGMEWYAPGFGIVKTLSKHGSTEITSIK